MAWFAGEFLIGVISVLVGYSLRNLSITGAGPAEWHPGAFPSALIFGGVLALSCFASGINGYQGRRPSRYRILLLAFFCTAIASLSLVSFFYLFLMQVGRVLIVIIFILTFGLIVSIRSFALKLEKKERRKALLIRSDKNAMPPQMLDLINHNYDIAVIESGVFGEGPLLAIVEEWKSEGFDDVVLGQQSKMIDNEKLFVLCWQNDIRLLDWNYFVEMNFRKLNVYDQNLTWLMELEQHYAHPAYSRVKRFIDLVGAGCGLIFGAPLFLLGAILVLLDSRGPVFFKQRRVGLRGEIFTLIKFRTMVTEQSAKDSKWSQKSDSRVRAIGRFLRRSRIDELPQLVNVLKGEMTLVGPRPEWDEIAESWSERIPCYAYRSMVKPGLTGWAQINFGYAETKDEVLEKLSYDFYYIKHASVSFDISILLKTLSSMFVGGR
ncbi:MAG: exopolysaccharide biosynthesis polyprenyl glycosylphosphotransferase [Verrucomicrobiales bacterium]|nr:exopolysaccharide biosynthesis polyprenyl glycosylphosphotransferase [Verrucomicrobiales bacterium]